MSEPTCNCFSADGWRIVLPNEVLQEGDEYRWIGLENEKPWSPVSLNIGLLRKTLSQNAVFRTRRHLANCPAVKETETPKSETPRQYYDMDGSPISLLSLVKKEPEWAANQILNRDLIESELNEANANHICELRNQMIEYSKSLTATQQRLKEMAEVARELWELLKTKGQLINYISEKEYAVLSRLEKLEESK